MKIESIVSNRKQVVKAMEEITGHDAVYLGAPSFAFEIGSYTVDRSGCITAEEIGVEVIDSLIAKGIVNDPEEDTTKTTITLPMEGHRSGSLKNLVFLLYSKGNLISKAVGKPGFYKVSELLVTNLKVSPLLTVEEFIQVIDDTGEGSLKGLSFEEDKIRFYFPYTKETDWIQTYRQLATLMAKMAKEQSRVTPTMCKETNEKYTFRGWLIRLGMNGPEYRTARKMLLCNLKGNTAFRTKDQEEVAKEKMKAQRAKEREIAQETAFVAL